VAKTTNGITRSKNKIPSRVISNKSVIMGHLNRHFQRRLFATKA
jgi:hypothetical protein